MSHSYCCDIHTHSIASGHGSTDTISDMAKEASLRGITLLGISDHGPATLCSGTVSYFRSLTMSPKERFGVTLLYGAELNILNKNGTMDLDTSVCNDLDYCIASLHTKNIKPMSRSENTEAYLAAMEHSFVRLLGHIDDSAFPIHMKEVVQAAKERRILLELNEASLRPDSYRGNTLAENKALLSYCMEYEQPIVLSSDSHGKGRIGEFSCGNTLLKELQFPSHLVLNDKPTVLRGYLYH